MNEQNLDYLSGEVREILAKPPSSVTKYAFIITMCMLGLLTIAAFNFSYPEIIVGDLVLTTAKPPINVDAPKTGTLAKVMVQEKAFVTKDDVIARFETDADVNDVLNLEKDLEELNTLDVDAIRAFVPDRNLDLDQQLSVLYEDFISSLEFVPLYEGDQIDQDAINAIYSENTQINRSNQSLLDAIGSAENEIKTQQKLHDNTFELYQETPGQSNLSNKLYQIDQKKKSLESEISRFRSEIEKNYEKIKNNNSQILQMRANRSSGTQERIFQLRQNLSSLRKAIAKWKSDNLVIAPGNGQVSFYANLELKKRYKKGEELVAIIPEPENTEYIGLVNIPIRGSGKVEEEQEVNLKFHRYPFVEFGAVKGKVSKIYPLAKGDAYSVEVALDNGLITNHGRALDYFQQMEGTAEIITNERLFVSRLFDKVISTWRD